MTASRTEDRQVLPIFRNGEMPARQHSRQFVGARAFALFTLALTFVYLWWRAGSGTINLSVWWVAVPLFLAEVHNFVGLGLFTASLWRTDTVTPPATRPIRAHSVAVVLPTFNEPEEILLPAIAAAVALQPEHETWVLDDGRRPEIRELAERLGARYLARPTNEHAKAGNVNHALPYIKADVIAFLDADYVALPGFLERTLPYFDDPRIAIVQTPQDFYNLDSFEHERRGEDGASFYEEGVFYRMIGPGKNAWGGAFWCGTCALVRADALRDVGGVATDTITEDIHTTIRMHRRGWKSIYHNEVLSRGLAPSDAAQYLMQRNRWAIGAMQVLHVENPLFASGLRLGQRLSYLTTLFAWFDAWRTLAYLALPAMVLFSGVSPIDAPGYVYGPFFAAVFLTQLLTQRLLARGYYETRLSLVFEVLRMPAIIPATFAVLAPRRNWKFRVTPKGRMAAEGRDRVPVPWLLPTLFAANIAGLGWFAATLAGLTPMTYRFPAAAMGAAAFALLGSWLIFMAMRRIRAPRYSGERRNSVRFPVYLSASVDGTACKVIDLSVTGAQVELPAHLVPSGEHAVLLITGPDGVVTVNTNVRRRIPRPAGNIEVGLEFQPGQQTGLARVALWLFTYTAGQAPVAPPPLEVGRAAA